MEETLKAVTPLHIMPVITEQNLNRMAQYLYEGIQIAPDLTLIMDMTSKETLVRVLRLAMIRAGILTETDDWHVRYLHVECAICEHCAELAIDSAKATGSTGGSWTQLEYRDNGSRVAHRSVVERKA